MRGIYLLVLKLEKPLVINVGSLGKIKFPKGYYVYIGSAQNSIEKRISRHINKNKKKHWHIDYLTVKNGVFIEKIYYKELDKKYEVKIALFFSQLFKPIKKFGSTDSKAISHLFFLNKDYNKLEKVMNKLCFKVFIHNPKNI